MYACGGAGHARQWTGVVHSGVDAPGRIRELRNRNLERDLAVPFEDGLQIWALTDGRPSARAGA